ncbi:MAG: hypothetical protein JSU01_18405 [Bacteroidetes bacterium]|nr:hypothetical protein [Bacteroidota bacterium]
MNPRRLFFLLSFLPQVLFAQTGGKDIVKRMYERYHGKWQAGLTFVQTTEQYRNDSLKKTAIWHEAALFPDKLRIDMGAIADQNAIIFRNDSLYNFRKGKLLMAGEYDDDLSFLLGGLYFYPLDTALEKFGKYGYDLSKSCTGTWQGRPVLIIGAASTDEHVTQLWVDQKNLYAVRMIKYNGNSKEEGRFDDHIQIGHGWSETKCTFYRNDKLTQTEYYKDCKPAPDLDLRLFDPASFGKVYWFKE